MVVSVVLVRGEGINPSVTQPAVSVERGGGSDSSLA